MSSVEKLAVILIFWVLRTDDVYVFRADGIKGEITRRPPACVAKFIKGLDQPPRTVRHALDRHSRLAPKRCPFYPPGPVMSPARAAQLSPRSLARLHFRFKQKWVDNDTRLRSPGRSCVGPKNSAQS